MDIFSQPLFIILAIVSGVVLVLHVYTGRRSSVRSSSINRSPLPSSSPQQVDLLLAACLGDRGKVTRLVDYEKKRSPGISDALARQRALERITRDNSRW